MTLGVLNTLAQELRLVNAKIGRYCQVRSGYLGEFAHLELDRIDQILRPACVLSVAGHFKCEGAKAVALATIAQLIFLADKIHSAVPEDEGSELADTLDPRDSSQLPVLVGDYLYGRFFTTLCEEGILEYLEPLARMICTINEGSILRCRAVYDGDYSQNTVLKIVEKETGLFFADSCRLSANLGGASEEEQNLLSKFGYNLGMAYGLLRERGYPQLATDYQTKARDVLAGLKNSQFVNHLCDLTDHLFETT